MTHSDGREEVVVDNWRTSEEPHKAYADFWKGRAEFVLASRPTGKKLTGKQSTLPQLRNVQLEPVAADATSAAQPASSAASSSRPPQRTVAEPSTSAELRPMEDTEMTSVANFRWPLKETWTTLERWSLSR